jgi:hypothetical protein
MNVSLVLLSWHGCYNDGRGAAHLVALVARGCADRIILGVVMKGAQVIRAGHGGMAAGA